MRLGYIVHYGAVLAATTSRVAIRRSRPVLQAPEPVVLGQFALTFPDSNVEFANRRLDDTDTQYAYSSSTSITWARMRTVCTTTGRPVLAAAPLGTGMVFPKSIHGTPIWRTQLAVRTISRVDAALVLITWAAPTPSTVEHSATMQSRERRLNRTWGEPDSLQLSTAWTPVYHQRVTEQVRFHPAAALPDFDTNLPFSYLVDPGAFTELTVNWLPYLSSTLGARVDWVTYQRPRK